MLAYGVAGVEPVDLVTGPGNVYVAAAKRLLRGVGRHRLRGRPERGRGARRRHRRPGARRRGPAQPGRARPDLAASVLVTDSPALADAVERQLADQVAATKHVQRVTAALTGPQSGVVLVRDLDAGPRRRGRVRGRAPRGDDPGRGRGGPPGAQRRLRLRRPALAGLARRLRRRLQPRAAHRRQLPAHRRAVGADVPARRQPGGVRPRPRSPRWPGTSSRWPTPRTCPRTPPPSPSAPSAAPPTASIGPTAADRADRSHPAGRAVTAAAEAGRRSRAADPAGPPARADRRDGDGGPAAAGGPARAACRTGRPSSTCRSG